MAFTSNIQKSNIRENWLFQLEYYNGDSGGDGRGGFDQIYLSDGTTAMLANEHISSSETSINVDNNTMFIVGDFIKIDNEVMKITAVSGGSHQITVIRGVKGTTKAEHDNDSPIYWYNFLPLAFNDVKYDNIFYYGVISNAPSIRESIDLTNYTAKSSNISITFPDFNYEGSPISEELFGTRKYINRVASVYSSIDGQTTNKIASFRINNITTNGFNITVSLISHRPWDNISAPQTKTTTMQNYFPIVYGTYTGSSSSYGSEGYIETFSKNLFPVKVDKLEHAYFKTLLHSDLASTSIRLRYYETGFDAFVPLESAETSESYENGIMVKTDWHLRRHFKFKPTSAISKTFADITDIINGTTDQTISSGYEQLAMDETNSGASSGTLEKDNIFNFPAFDDPPDITTSSNNNGFIIQLRWKMINFYGDTSNESGLAKNEWALYNNSRYATGDVGDSGSIANGVVFATNGSYDYVNTATGSSNAAVVSERTSATSGSATATEFSQYPYDNGLSIRFLRTVVSNTDGGGGTNANINSDLQIADLRCKVTCRIDKYNTSTDGFARMSNIEKLYCANNGLNNGITGLSGAVDEIHQAHLDILNRFCGIDVATNPATNIDGWSALDTSRDAWDIRWWLDEPTPVEEILNQMQYEGQFIFRFKQGDFTQPQYIHIANSPSSILTLSKNDLDKVKLNLSNPNDIITKTTVNYNRHPALDSYQDTVTGVNETSRKNYNIEDKENIREVNLDMLVNNIGDTNPTGENKNSNFLANQNSLFGDIYLTITCDIINPAKWVDSSLNPIEVGSIIDFNNNNMFPKKPLGFNSGSWSGLNFVITNTSRSLGKLTITARSV